MVWCFLFDVSCWWNLPPSIHWLALAACFFSYARLVRTEDGPIVGTYLQKTTETQLITSDLPSCSSSFQVPGIHLLREQLNSGGMTWTWNCQTIWHKILIITYSLIKEVYSNTFFHMFFIVSIDFYFIMVSNVQCNFWSPRNWGTGPAKCIAAVAASIVCVRCPSHCSPWWWSAWSSVLDVSLVTLLLQL